MVVWVIFSGSVLLNVVLIYLAWKKDIHMKTDPLTKVFNVRAFKRYLHKKKHDKQFSLALIDIDYFKNVNDTYGHTVGDGVLEALAQRLRNTVRVKDFVARYGGEEFVILFPDCGRDEAFQIIERIRRNIEEYLFRIKQLEIRITISGGVATYPHVPFDQVLEFADEALYQAKREGRNKVMMKGWMDGNEPALHIKPRDFV